MTASTASAPPSLAARVRRAALLLGVLPTCAAILVITLGRVESLANTAMFVPLGASLGLAVRPRSWPLVALAGAALSAAVELAQTRLPGRVPDVHDLVANTGGGLIGLAVAVALVAVAHLAALLVRISRPDRGRPLAVR